MTNTNPETGALASLKGNSSAPSYDNASIAQLYFFTRQYSEEICEPLTIEDYGLQATEFTSPAKWHLAHTTWFFETFILKPYSAAYQVFHSGFEYLFNSYYNAVGDQYPRAQRGLLTRPTVEEVYRYRRHVDDAIAQLLESLPAATADEIFARLELGCHHEQQHQELFFTDLKYCWFQNPLYPAYRELPAPPSPSVQPSDWRCFEGQLHQVGHEGTQGFCFDNELPRHRHYVEGFRIADRLVSNGEYLSFMADGGYESPELWLADGWAALTAPRRKARKHAPFYWVKKEGQWWEYTLYGLLELDPARPVCHLSAYEADAFARWRGCRLPTEFEWEVAATALDTPTGIPSTPRTPAIHPQDCELTGNLWQWTSSAYSPYPGFKVADGAIGEYNGKFMANQLVLRGGSIATSPGHYRHSYRNFFYPPDQWQFTGVRLAQDL
jgi:ergothioneine biosynthesis protein EgtB